MHTTPTADRYKELLQRINTLVHNESDLIAVMSTIVCDVYHAFDHFDWVGFYRVSAPSILKVGPYQGTHGCLTIPFSRGVCGRCARERRTQIVDNVRNLDYHIACSSSTASEIVIPVLDATGGVRAVLDVDSDTPEAFGSVDAAYLDELCRILTPLYAPAMAPPP